MRVEDWRAADDAKRGLVIGEGKQKEESVDVRVKVPGGIRDQIRHCCAKLDSAARQTAASPRFFRLRSLWETPISCLRWRGAGLHCLPTKCGCPGADEDASVVAPRLVAV